MREIGGDFALSGLSEEEVRILGLALDKGINAPATSSAGRLFDAAAVLCGVCLENSFEGEAAMALEFSAMKADCDEVFEFDFCDGIVDWRPLFKALIREAKQNPNRAARMFHNTMADVIVSVARGQDCRRVLLTGGCFQNKLLLEITLERLREAGFEAYWHRSIPPNDGGLAAGQVIAALRAQKDKGTQI